MILPALACLLLSSCNKDGQDTYLVAYTLGCSDCQVAYVSDGDGTQVSEDHQNNDWTYSFEAKQGQEVFVFGYNTSGSPQGVSVSISVNGSVTKQRTTYCPISGVSFVVDTI